MVWVSTRAELNFKGSFSLDIQLQKVEMLAFSKNITLLSEYDSSWFSGNQKPGICRLLCKLWHLWIGWESQDALKPGKCEKISSNPEKWNCFVNKTTERKFCCSEILTQPFQFLSARISQQQKCFCSTVKQNLKIFCEWWKF